MTSSKLRQRRRQSANPRPEPMDLIPVASGDAVSAFWSQSMARAIVRAICSVSSFPSCQFLTSTCENSWACIRLGRSMCR